MKKLCSGFAMAFLCGWGGVSGAQTASSTPGSHPPAVPETSGSASGALASGDSKAFVIHAWQDGALDIAVSELALQKSSNPAVRRFAEQMIAGRLMTNNMIKQAAQGRHITLPDGLTSDHAQLLGNLAQLSGNAFDLTYLHHHLMMHELHVRRLTEQEGLGTDPHIKDLAVRILPVMQAQAAAAREINARIHPSNS